MSKNIFNNIINVWWKKSGIQSWPVASWNVRGLNSTFNGQVVKVRNHFDTLKFQEIEIKRDLVQKII